MPIASPDAAAAVRPLRGRRQVPTRCAGSRGMLVAALVLLGGSACAPGPDGPSGSDALPGADGTANAPAGANGVAASAPGTPAPCQVPVAWRIGFVDSRFGLHGSELRSAVEEAVALWESAAGRELFRHDPHEGMPVDLVYDERQRQLAEQVEAEERLDRWEAELAHRPRTAPEVERYNRLVDRYNAALDEYRALPTLQFQVAEYSHKLESGSGRIVQRRVTVWAMDSRTGLVTALAHEMAHALGLGHVSDPSALMTAEGDASQVTEAALHPADVAELRRVCGLGSG